jgi:hypothetical protein
VISSDEKQMEVLNILYLLQRREWNN